MNEDQNDAQSVRDGAAFLKLTLAKMQQETRDIKTFVFRLEGGVPAYEAGQSMTLRLSVDGETLLRTFSLASAPGQGDTLAMTIKTHEKGRATRWLHECLGIGDVIEARHPRGRFTITNRQSEKIALVSAGSGASPLMAMLRHLADVAPGTDIAWLHAARMPDDLLFADELATLQRKMSDLRIAMLVSRPEPGWFGFSGRIGRRLVSVAMPDFGRREVFCCGPTGFMEAARLIHAAEGGRRDLFHIEHFGAHAPSARPQAPQSPPDARFTIRLGKRTFEARPGETLLAAATRQAIVIPCGCASGMCGTCRVALVRGEVAMQHQGGLSPEEEAEGFILACSSRPLSDVTIAL